MGKGGRRQPDQQYLPSLLWLDHRKTDEISEVTSVGHVSKGQIDRPDNEPLDARRGIQQVATLVNQISQLVIIHIVQRRVDVLVWDSAELQNGGRPRIHQVAGRVLDEGLHDGKSSPGSRADQNAIQRLL